MQIARIGPADDAESGLLSSIDGGGTPAMLVDDSRASIAALNEARDRAAQVGTGLEQLESAADSATTVKTLLAQLGDAVVVSTGHGMQPQERAALQRQVNELLGEIDSLADGTLFNQELLRPGIRSASGQTATPAPFKQISTSALGLTELSVRSSDQAVAASGALDLAGTRLDRAADAVRRAQARLEDDLDALTSPPLTATGELALGNSTAAFGTTIQLRSDLLSSPGDALLAQSGLDVSRVFRLLDTSS
ncbi:MAG: hypothetical protein IT306_09675 [Chloroflexi bacterium]|nr:hypothetical protein [Chloroflexota bacterium]